jgi:hypothetical protein
MEVVGTWKTLASAPRIFALCRLLTCCRARRDEVNSGTLFARMRIYRRCTDRIRQVNIPAN